MHTSRGKRDPTGSKPKRRQPCYLPWSNLIKLLFIATHSSFMGFREQPQQPSLLITKPALLTFQRVHRSIIIETYIAQSDLRTEAGMPSLKNETHLLYLQLMFLKVKQILIFQAHIKTKIYNEVCKMHPACI